MPLCALRFLHFLFRGEYTTREAARRRVDTRGARWNNPGPRNNAIGEMNMTLKASIDWDKCEGNGVCARVAPEVFSVDDQGNSDVLMEEVPESLRAKAMLAMRQCPTGAVSVVEA